MSIANFMESSKNLAVFCLGLPFTSVMPFFSINGIVPVEDEEPRLYKSFSCFQIIKMYLTLEETVRGGTVKNRISGCGHCRGFFRQGILKMVYLNTFVPVKMFCVILSCFVLLFSTKPCCADNECQLGVSTGKKKIEKSSSQEKECPGCSPFFSCGSCPGFIVVIQLTTTLPALSETPVKAYTPYGQSLYKQITLSVWQPPKLS